MRRPRMLLMGVAGLVSLVSAGLAWSDEPAAPASDGHALTLEAFVRLAARRDTNFEQILIDELALRYEKALQLPAKDLVLSVKEEYQLFVEQDREESATTASLSRLFPMIGAEIEAEYTVTPSFTTSRDKGELTVTLAQDIAQNAFGRSTRMLDRIVGLEVEIARHQVIEAYEDYLAGLMQAYLDWYEAHENLRIGESSYQENLKLLDNIKERERSKIALPLDVNKITLQVMAKDETLIQQQERYQSRLNVILAAIRSDGGEPVIPQAVEGWTKRDLAFEEDFERFEASSRTYGILRLFEEQRGMETRRAADDLLPSIQLRVGFEKEGADYRIGDEETRFFAGITGDWPFPDQVDRAEYEVAKLDERKAVLSTENTHYLLFTQISNLHHEIDRERRLAEIAEAKVRVAESVLEDETENYTFGKVTLNDYIDAVNVLDATLFNQVLRDVRLRKLVVEWRRLTDRLITREQVHLRHPTVMGAN